MDGCKWSFETNILIRHLITEGAQILLIIFIARFSVKKFIEKFDSKSEFRDFHQNSPHVGKTTSIVKKLFWS